MNIPAPDSAARKHYDAALELISELMKGDPSPDTPEGLLLSVLAQAIETYERAILPPPFGSNAPSR